MHIYYISILDMYIIQGFFQDFRRGGGGGGANAAIVGLRGGKDCTSILRGF